MPSSQGCLFGWVHAAAAPDRPGEGALNVIALVQRSETLEPSPIGRDGEQFRTIHVETLDFDAVLVRPRLSRF